MDNLFRKEVVEDRLSQIGLPMRITSVWMHLFTGAFVTFILLIALVIANGTYARKASVQGFLLPDSGIVKVSSPREGRVIESHINEGQQVNEGDLLFVIDVGAESIGGNTIDLTYENLTQRKSLIEQEILLLKEIGEADAVRLEQNIELKEQEIGFATQESEAIETNLELLQRIVLRHEDLSSRQLSPVDTREEAEKDLIEARLQAIGHGRYLVTLRSELDQLRTEQRVLRDRQASEKSNLLRELSSLNQQILELDNQRAILVRAPKTGIVTRQTKSVGAVVDAEDVLLSIVPDGALLEAYLYLPSKDAGFVSIGTEILIRYDAYPYQKFGLYKAFVSTISQAAVTSAELPIAVSSTTDELLFVVTARLEKAFVLVAGEERPLQVGTKFQADLVLEERMIWEWLLGPLRRLRASA
ncbi:MAG: HlyD family efflux transporter periplasmic adaptor subunit [Pseudomonadota bacterium]